MPRIGRFPSTPTIPARFVTGLVLAALVILHGPASAQQAAGTRHRRRRPQNRAAVRATPPTSGSAARPRAASPSLDPTAAFPPISAIAARPRTATPPIDPAVAKARALQRSIEWQEAPEIAGLGVVAEFRIPRGYAFTGAKGAKAFLELAHAPAPKDLLGILVPSGSSKWFLVFEAREAVRKEEGKGKPDADALLRELRAQNEVDNATRRAHGWVERTDLDWEQPPSYDQRTGNLTWTTKANSQGRRVVRSTTRMFGRRGAVDAHLVAGADDMAGARNTLTNFVTLVQFTDGPNGGMRRDDLASSGSGGSTPSSTPRVAYVPTTTYSAGATRSIARSPRTIGGFATAFCSAMGAAFGRKRRSTS
jgi:hypothetical protein